METRGMRNHNPLNIRKGNNWQGEVSPQTDREFEQFSCDLYGLRAGMKILKAYVTKHNCNTLRRIITRWAPPTENDTNAYIATVAKRAGVDADQKIAFGESSKICAIVKAMCYVESRYEPSDRLIAQAYALV